MKALKYTGLPPGTHTIIYDARDADKASGYHGSPLRIERDQVVPIEAFPNEEWSGDVAKIHVERGLAVRVGDKDEKAVPAAPAAK